MLKPYFNFNRERTGAVVYSHGDRTALPSRAPAFARLRRGEPARASDAQKYTCAMHPEVITDQPGNCPKCGMKLVPLKENKHSTLNSQLSTSNHDAMHHDKHEKRYTRLRTAAAMRWRWKCTPLSISLIR